MKRIFIFILILCMIPLVSSAVDTSTLELCLSMDNAQVDGATSEDLSNGEHDATIIGATTGRTGFVNQAYGYDGNDHLVVVDNTLTQEADKSVVFIMNFTDDTNFNIIYDQGNVGAGGGLGMGGYFVGGDMIVRSRDAGSTCKYTITHNLNVGTEYHIAVTASDNANLTLWVDGVEITSSITCDASGNAGGYSNFTIGETGLIGGYGYKGDLIDEFMFFNKTLKGPEVVELYNSGTPLGCVDIYPPVPPAASIDILIRNFTTSTGDKSVVGEDEHFWLYTNWTNDDDDSAINDTTGNCNASLEDGIIETESSTEDINLCNSGCDYDSFNDSFTILQTTGIKNNWVEIEGLCHNNTVVRDLSITVSCAFGSEVLTVSRNEFPTCAIGTADILKETAFCNTTNTTILLDNTATNPNQGHYLHELAYEREFTNLTAGMYFNTTLDLWRTDNYLEYHIHGVKNISTICTPDPESSLNASVGETLTVVNAAPIINFIQMNYSGGILNLTDSMNIEYYAGSFQWTAAVIDDDLTSINYTFYNTTGDQVHSEVSATPIDIITIDKTFLEFGANPYNFTIIATDSEVNITQSSLIFTVNDTGYPICVGIGNTSVFNNTVHTWNANCTDENFFSFNITCSDGSSFSQLDTGLNTQSYTFSNQTIITANTTCEIEYCDGHTKKVISDMEFSDMNSKYKRTVDYKISFTSDTELDEFNFEKKGDRYKFKIKPDKPMTNISFIIESDERIHMMNPVIYTGWIVTGDYWIDFVNENVIYSRVTRINNTIVEVYLEFSHPVGAVVFNSIGKLNCVQRTQLISITTTAPSPFSMERFECDLSTTPLSIALIGFSIIIVGLWIIGLILRIPLFNFFLGFLLLFYSWQIAACFLFAHLFFILMGFTSIALGVTDSIFKK